MDFEQQRFDEALVKFMTQNELLARIMEGTGQDYNLREIKRQVEEALETKDCGGIIPNRQSYTSEEDVFEAKIKRNYRSRKRICLGDLSEYLQNYYREFSQESFDTLITELRDTGEGAAVDLKDIYSEAERQINDVWYGEAEEFIDYTEGGPPETRNSLKDLVGRLEESITDNIRLGLDIIR